MAKSKSKRVLVAMVSKATGHRRVTRKNTINSPDKLVMKKYDPISRKVEEYVEKKVNLGRNEVKVRKK
ncbi:MAG: 50S ribosomal protein L33 [Patescibacteria group bacterium]